MLRLLLKPVLIIVAILLLLTGLLMLPLPVPFSFVPLIIGLALLVMVSATARAQVHALRRRYPGFDSKVAVLEKYLPQKLRHALSPTYNDTPAE